MLPTQILLNNFLYDLSELSIPTDNVDIEYVERPRRWDISFVRRFMLTFGPISSVFDFLTFFIMLFVFNATEPMFQTAWFLESLSTQALVIFAIRTRRTPFYRSGPSNLLLWGTLALVAIALILPFTPLGEVFGFVRLPLSFYVILAGLVGVYLVLVEIAKRRFYTQTGNRFV
jgi:Mg2+-importing ATPase